MAGIDEDEAKRILEFTLAKSNSHSAWLTFMYPRLYIARQLLRDDGVIFISIDDNEQAQLKVLCDEVFGEENVEQLIWNKESEGSSGTLKQILRFRTIHESIIVCYQNKSLQNFSRISESLPEKENKLETANLAVNEDSVKDGHKNWMELTSPTNKKWFKHWKFDNAEIKRLLEEDLIYWGKDGNNQPRLIIPNDERRTVYASSIINKSSTTQGRKDFESVMEEGVFSYPKPIELINFLTKISNSNELTLDFFAGSGTTAHAVMQLNAEDGGNRQFICVQLPETTAENSGAFKSGYKTIFDITHVRITKAAAKIKADNPTFTGDLGFKVFETTPVFEGYLNAPETLTENLTLFDANTLNQDERHTLMRTWALQDNIKLQTDLNPVKLGDYTAYGTTSILYFIEPNISLSAVVVLLEQLDNNPDFKPNMLVVLGYLLDSKTQREMTEAIKQYNNRKGIELTLDIRF